MLFFSFALALYALSVLVEPYHATSRNLVFGLVMCVIGLAFIVQDSKSFAKRREVVSREGKR